ncbi:MAG: GlsB/YeaQ/YmgE family stress response membrane protein [Actinomycetota bacterium]|nr:GlsB/YeaQ/YmgE family stress response membrane protein [Actinomycetota bacterium]
MGVIGWIVLGLIVGAIAKAVHRGEEPGGLLGTLVVGVLGALLGGLIASAAGIGGIGSFFSIATWLIAIGGALLLLVAFNAVVSRSKSARTAQ